MELETVLAFIIGGGVFYVAGWVRAHFVIANECKMLGKFYVGDRVFECTKISKKKI